MHQDLTHPRGATRVLWVAFVALLLIVLAPQAVAQEDEPTDDQTEQTTTDDADDATAASDEILSEGAEVYTAVCSACHQPGGVGIEGQFPPLLNNPNVQDTDYMETVIRNGLEGEIEVNGVTYNGRMPAFSTLPDDDVAAVIAYVQSGFAAPAAPPEAAGEAAADDGELPGGVNGMVWMVWAIAIGVGLWVLADRILGKIDRLTVPWLDAWLKTGIIVIWFVVFTVFVPSEVLQTEAVAKLSDTAQDLIGVSLWALGLGAGLAGLWYAHRESRI